MLAVISPIASSSEMPRSATCHCTYICTGGPPIQVGTTVLTRMRRGARPLAGGGNPAGSRPPPPPGPGGPPPRGGAPPRGPPRPPGTAAVAHGLGHRRHDVHGADHVGAEHRAPVLVAGPGEAGEEAVVRRDLHDAVDGTEAVDGELRQ